MGLGWRWSEGRPNWCIDGLMFDIRRLRRAVQGEMQYALETKCVHESVWHVLREVQVCASGYFREQGGLRHMLHRYDYTWQQDQVPLIVRPNGLLLFYTTLRSSSHIMLWESHRSFHLFSPLVIVLCRSIRWVIRCCVYGYDVLVLYFFYAWRRPLSLSLSIGNYEVLSKLTMLSWDDCHYVLIFY